MSREFYPLPGRLWAISLAEELTRRTKGMIAGWPKADREHLGDQWIRAMDSIGLNISEGSARIHTKERLHFFSYASGSLEEVIYCVRRARDRHLITGKEAWRFFQLLLRLGKSITNLTAESRSQS